MPARLSSSWTFFFRAAFFVVLSGFVLGGLVFAFHVNHILFDHPAPFTSVGELATSVAVVVVMGAAMVAIAYAASTRLPASSWWRHYLLATTNATFVCSITMAPRFSVDLLPLWFLVVLFSGGLLGVLLAPVYYWMSRHMQRFKSV